MTMTDLGLRFMALTLFRNAMNLRAFYLGVTGFTNPPIGKALAADA
jgi:hypothetical protein